MVQYFFKLFYLFKGVIRPICAKTTIKSKDHEEIREGRGTQKKSQNPTFAVIQKVRKIIDFVADNCNENHIFCDGSY